MQNSIVLGSFLFYIVEYQMSANWEPWDSSARQIPIHIFEGELVQIPITGCFNLKYFEVMAYTK